MGKTSFAPSFSEWLFLKKIFSGYYILNTVLVQVLFHAVWSNERQMNCYAFFLSFLEAPGFMSQVVGIRFVDSIFG